MGLINLLHKAKLAKLLGQAIEHPELLRTSKFWYELFKAIWGVKEVRTVLKGYKTYIVAALTAGVMFLYSMGYIDETLRDTLLGLLGAGALGTVAAKINRIQADINNSKK